MTAEDTKAGWDLVELKAELLCCGLRATDTARAIFADQNPCEDWKTGNVGLHLRLENGSHVLVTISHRFDQLSRYSIERDSGLLTLLKDGTPVGRVEAVPMPKWYARTATTGTRMASVFLHEGKAFLHQAYSGCDFHAQGLGCRFCGTGAKRQIGTPAEVGETVSAAIQENPAYHVCLGGGTQLPLTRNASYFRACAEEIRSRQANVPIWIETTPPGSDKEIDSLVEAGATSFGFNLEIWNDRLRREICPGKSRIPKARYLEALGHVLHVLGSDRTGSCLIVGLEPLESTIDGARRIASAGAQPCLLPFRPWDGSAYADHNPCSASDLISASTAAVAAMIKGDLHPEGNQGCFRCEGCTIDHDILALEAGQEGVAQDEDSGS